MLAELPEAPEAVKALTELPLIVIRSATMEDFSDPLPPMVTSALGA